jgi:uncharacterized protein YfaT (DUF1175 family)
MKSLSRAGRIILPLFLLTVAGCGRDHLVFSRTTVFLPADGRVRRVGILARRSGGAIAVGSMDSVSSGLQLEQSGPDRIAVLVRSPVMPVVEHPSIFWRGHRYALSFRFFPVVTDSFGDGLPDALRLHSAEDRRAFRAWFVAIAEQEAALPNEKLLPEIDDCAALLRYAYREALVEHDARWFAKQPQPQLFVPLESISQYHYPQPPLGLGLFRVKPGRFEEADTSNGSFAQFADAHTLMALNTHWIGRDVRAARPGDLLFFRQLEQNSEYHSMIVAGANSDWVIYHTGPIGKRKGEIRRVTMQDLLHHPDARWRPVPQNTNFLGVYRWNVLRDGD